MLLQRGRKHRDNKCLTRLLTVVVNQFLHVEHVLAITITLPALVNFCLGWNAVCCLLGQDLKDALCWLAVRCVVLSACLNSPVGQ